MNTTHRSNGRRFSCPEVAKLAARALIKHAMNASAAARELRPHLSEKSASVVGARMLRTPEVQAELERQLQPKGLDQQSRDALVSILWAWLRGSDRQLKQTVARILGRGLIGEQLRLEKPEVLRFEGFEEGVKRMMSDIPSESSEYTKLTDTKEVAN